MPWLLKARVELGSLLCSQTPLLAPSGTEGEAGWSTVLMSGIWDVLGKVSEQGERGMESMVAPSQGKDLSDHSYSLLRVANRFFRCHGLVLFTLTWGWVRCVVREEITCFKRLNVEKEEQRSHQDLVTDIWVCLSRNCSCDGSARNDGEGHLRRGNSNWQFWLWVKKDW